METILGLVISGITGIITAFVAFMILGSMFSSASPTWLYALVYLVSLLSGAGITALLVVNLGSEK